MAISTGVSTRKESKQSDQRLENLSSEQKQVDCNGYESLITISGGKKAKPRYNKTYKYTHHGEVSFFFLAMLNHTPCTKLYSLGIAGSLYGIFLGH